MPSLLRSPSLLAYAVVALALLSNIASASPLPTQVERRQVAANDPSLASSAISVYENQGTTPFTQPTGGACPVGFQSYIDATSGLQQCCAGSIVNQRCFADGGTLIYTADPYSAVQAGGVATTTDPALLPTSTTALVPTTSSVTAGGPVATGSVRPTTGTYTITSYTPIATGGTRNGVQPSSSISRLSQTLTPTGGGSARVGNANAAQRGGAAGAVMAVAVAMLVGGGVALW